MNISLGKSRIHELEACENPVEYFSKPGLGKLSRKAFEVALESARMRDEAEMENNGTHARVWCESTERCANGKTFRICDAIPAKCAPYLNAK